MQTHTVYACVWDGSHPLYQPSHVYTQLWCLHYTHYISLLCLVMNELGWDYEWHTTWISMWGRMIACASDWLPRDKGIHYRMYQITFINFCLLLSTWMIVCAWKKRSVQHNVSTHVANWPLVMRTERSTNPCAGDRFVGSMWCDGWHVVFSMCWVTRNIAAFRHQVYWLHIASVSWQ
jgi:hypothetical protein